MQRGLALRPPPLPPRCRWPQIRSNVASIKNVAVERVLITAIDAAQGDFERACTNLEHWYDSSMDRVSGWYKRSRLTDALLGAGLKVAPAPAS